MVDGDGRREAGDLVHVRLLHLAEELAGVGRERLHVAALTLGKYRVKGQGRLARAREAGKDHHLVARHLDRDVLQVMSARALDHEFFSAWVEVGFCRRFCAVRCR